MNTQLVMNEKIRVAASPAGITLSLPHTGLYMELNGDHAAELLADLLSALSKLSTGDASASAVAVSPPEWRVGVPRGGDVRLSVRSPTTPGTAFELTSNSAKLLGKSLTDMAGVADQIRSIHG